MLAISTKMQKVDWNNVRNNYLDPSIWDEKWTIYKCGDYEITIRLTHIKTASKTLEFEISDNSRVSWSTNKGWHQMKVDHEESIDSFEKILINKIRSIIIAHGSELANEYWDDENGDKVTSLRRSLGAKFDELAEAVDLGDMADYIDLDDIKDDFIRQHNYLSRDKYDYISDNKNNFVVKELSILEEVNKVYDVIIPGCEIELDTEFIEKLELEL